MALEFGKERVRMERTVILNLLTKMPVMVWTSLNDTWELHAFVSFLLDYPLELEHVEINVFCKEH